MTDKDFQNSTSNLKNLPVLPLRIDFFERRKAKSKWKDLQQKEVRSWLSSQKVYTLHKPTRKKFPRRKTISSGIDDQWQMDLVIMSSIARHNKNYNYTHYITQTIYNLRKCYG